MNVSDQRIKCVVSALAVGDRELFGLVSDLELEACLYDELKALHYPHDDCACTARDQGG